MFIACVWVSDLIRLLQSSGPIDDGRECGCRTATATRRSGSEMIAHCLTVRSVTCSTAQTGLE
jgi:hypothetical protein